MLDKMSQAKYHENERQSRRDEDVVAKESKVGQ
jgi:hypothetical protein